MGNPSACCSRARLALSLLGQGALGMRGQWEAARGGLSVKPSSLRGSTETPQAMQSQPHAAKTRVGRSAEEQAASWRCASCAPFLQVQACSATPGIPPLLALASPHHYSRHPRSPRQDTTTQPGGPGAPRSYIPRLRSALSRDGVFAPVQRWGRTRTPASSVRRAGAASAGREEGRPGAGSPAEPGQCRSGPGAAPPGTARCAPPPPTSR